MRRAAEGLLALVVSEVCQGKIVRRTAEELLATSHE